MTYCRQGGVAAPPKRVSAKIILSPVAATAAHSAALPVKGATTVFRLFP